MGLIVAGERSGVGKTTIALAMLAFLANRGHRVQSFKVGPDYIDPMFHSLATGKPCRNLDPVLTSPSYVKNCFDRHTKNTDCAVVEGVMGLFDGIDRQEPNKPSLLNDYGSTAHIARILNLPVVLVLDCSRMSSSIAAIAFGYANLDPQVRVAGVILNKVASDRHLELLETALAAIEMPILGVLRRHSQINLPDRHLGLIPTDEIPQFTSILNELVELARSSFYWDKLLPLIASEHQTFSNQPSIPTIQRSSIRIAVARDRAFNFYYQDNFDILQELGAELIYWSPMSDRAIPNNIQGLYFGGGFPEVFARQLSANKYVLQQLKQIILAGIPTYAECGGLMYLCEGLIDLEGQTRSMVGAIPSDATMQSKLTLGYRQAIALQDSCLIAVGDKAVGHEFHRSRLTQLADSPQWQLQGFHKSSVPFPEGWQIANLHASYLHVHWGEARYIAERFVKYCQNYQT